MNVEWWVRSPDLNDKGIRSVTIPDEDLEGLTGAQRESVILRTVQGAFFESDIVFVWGERAAATNGTGG